MQSEVSNNEPPHLDQEVPLSLMSGVLFMFAVLMALPVSQCITEIRDQGNIQIEVAEFTPPQLTDTPPPPPDEPEKQDIEKIEETREPPTLAQLELAMSTDLSGFASSDFTMPTISLERQFEEFIYELEDLTRAPRPRRRPQPVYPPEMRRANIEGTVVLKFVVNADGTTSRITVERSDNPAFEDPAIRAVRRWEFDPGEKDGKPVPVWVRQPIPFTIR
jgi:protein TonB